MRAFPAGAIHNAFGCLLGLFVLCAVRAGVFTAVTPTVNYPNYDHTSNGRDYGVHICIAAADSMQEKICKSLGGVLKQSGGYNYYAF